MDTNIYSSEGKCEYTKRAKSRILFLAVAAVLCLLSFAIDICVGPAMIGLQDVVRTILGLETSNPNTHVVIISVRFPAALMAIAVGGTLGLAGAGMQTILDNPLASPYTLGVSASAGFGASLALISGAAFIPIIGIYSVPLLAFFFSILANTLIYSIGRIKGMSSEIMVLSGIGIMFLFQALQSFMQYIATPEVLQSIVFWIFGSLSKSNIKNALIVLLTLCICFPMILKDAWKLTALRLGDEKAANLGVDIERLRIKVFIIISLLTSVAVCFVGTIGFIGLVGPHIARIMVGEDQRFFLPLSTLCGMLILSLASIGSKLIVPGIIFPIGIITSIIGIPFFFLLIFGKKRRYL